MTCVFSDDTGQRSKINTGAAFCAAPARAGEDKYESETGIGIGPYIAREKAKAHGGAIIEAHSEGTEIVFAVRLPRSQSA